MPTLLFVALVDELWSGVAVAGAPSVEHELALSHKGYVLFAFALPLVVAAALEGGLALLSDVWDRARLLVLAQGGLAASLFFTAWTSSAWGLTVGLAFAGATSGVACGAAQALLLASSPSDADRTMVRWSLYCAIGDVLTPLVTATAVALGYSYRGAMAVIALVVALQCAASIGGRGRRPSPADAPPGPEEPSEPLRAALMRSIGRPRLWAWLFAAASCTLLDELVIALAALRLERDRGTSAAFAAAAAVSFAVGAVAGSALTERAASRISARRILVTSAALCALALVVFLMTANPLASCLGLLFVGLTCAPHHPLAMARAYEELPGRPGTVQAIGQLFVVVDVVAPIALGALADRYGLGVAMACLLLQPVIVGIFGTALAQEKM